MAYAMTKRGSLDNCITYEFMCDTVADMNRIENEYRTLGSVAIVLNGESGSLEVYITDSSKEWHNFSAASGGGSTAEGAGLKLHLCTQNEIEEGLPNISNPDENTIYLVPGSEEENNLYEEYFYIDDGWEKFGSAGVDLSGYYQKPLTGIPASDLADGVIPDTSIYAPIASPNFTGSISLGRAANTTIGAGSVAEGTGITASGYASHAEGGGTTASGDNAHAEGKGNKTSTKTINNQTYTGTGAHGEASHAEGGNTWAIGRDAHAEGGGTTASGDNSHAEGEGTIASGYISHAEGSSAQASGDFSHAEGGSTIASGAYSHVEGHYTIAAGRVSHVGGEHNIEDSYANWSEWTAGTSYEVGDKVKRTTGSGSSQTIQGYICKTANSDSTFKDSKWENQYKRMNYAEIIGNGTYEARSNARALDWDGNEHLMGDLYVGCNADSTGGVKIPRIPSAPTADGTYTLQVIVTNGTPTYSWVSAG